MGEEEKHEIEIIDGRNLALFAAAFEKHFN
jgi:hypothetical protein